MDYRLILDSKIDKLFFKLAKKDKFHLQIIEKKIKEILEDPYKFKPLRGNLKNMWRVHIGKSFVLIYEIIEEKKIVKLLDYNHHDKVYKN